MMATFGTPRGRRECRNHELFVQRHLDNMFVQTRLEMIRRTHDQFNKGVIESLILHVSSLLDEIENVINEVVVKYS